MAILRGRAPLRLGLGGGGTDVEPYSSQFGGRILSVTIDKYAYAFAERGTGDEIAFRSPDRDRAGQASIDDLASLEEDFPLHVAVYRRVIAEFNGGTPFPLQLATQVDAPPGSGLGSSSALVVAMLLTTCALIGSSPGPYELARLAWEIERVDLGMAGGWQDHYAAAFGGFNFMESRPNGEVVVNPLRIRREVIAELEASLLLYFGGVSRLSSEVIADQQRNVVERDADALAATHSICAEALEMKDLLVVGDIPGFADSLLRGWQAKKRTAAVPPLQPIPGVASVSPANGAVVGVAHPVVVTFTTPVTDRRAVERSIRISTPHNTTGHFEWVASNVVRWVPHRYWPPHTRVSVGVQELTEGFETGDALIGVASISAHTFTVRYAD